MEQRFKIGRKTRGEKKAPDWKQHFCFYKQWGFSL